jgi:hypothetical protein
MKYMKIILSFLITLFFVVGTFQVGRSVGQAEGHDQFFNACYSKNMRVFRHPKDGTIVLCAAGSAVPIDKQ